MAVVTYDLSLNARETKEFDVVFKNTDGSPILLTGVTVNAEIVEFIGTAKLPAVFTCTVSADTGTVSLKLTTTESDKLQAFDEKKANYWNLFVTYPNETKKKRVEGKVKIKKAAR